MVLLRLVVQALTNMWWVRFIRRTLLLPPPGYSIFLMIFLLFNMPANLRVKIAISVFMYIIFIYICIYM